MLLTSSDTKRSNNDTSILAYKFLPKRTGFNMYAEYTRPQLTFLALVPWTFISSGFLLHGPRFYSLIKIYTILYYRVSPFKGQDSDFCNVRE